MSGLSALVFCLGGCELGLDIPDEPHLAADAGAAAMARVPSPGSSIDTVGTPEMPNNGPANSAEERSAASSPTDGVADTEPLDAGPPSNRAPDDPATPAASAPAPAADPAPGGAAPDASSPPADPAPADPAPTAEPAPTDPPPVYPDPEPEDPDPPTVGDPPPRRCRGAESTGPDGRCYLAVSQSLSWNAARTNCRDRGDGWDLTAIRSNAVNRFVGDLIVSQAWIGATDAAIESEWAWVDDGTSFWVGTGTTGRALNRAYENWNSDEPNGGDNTNCARLVTVTSGAPNGSPAWADLECGELLPSVCAGPTR